MDEIGTKKNEISIEEAMEVTKKHFDQSFVCGIKVKHSIGRRDVCAVLLKTIIDKGDYSIIILLKKENGRLYASPAVSMIIDLIDVAVDRHDVIWVKFLHLAYGYWRQEGELSFGWRDERFKLINEA